MIFDEMTKKKEVWTTLIFMWLGHFLCDLMIGSWSVYKTIANLDLAIAGIIAGVCPFIGEGMQMYFGSLGDKGHRKELFLLGLIGTSANAFLAYTTNYWLLFCIFLTTCIGSGAFHPSAVAITTSLTQKRRSLFVTIFASGGYLGLAFSQLAFSKTYFALDGNTGFLAIPIYIFTLVAAYIGFRGKGHMIAPPGRRFGLSAFRHLLKSKELVNLYGTQVCNQAVVWATIFLLPDILSYRGYDRWLSFGGGHLFYILGSALAIIPGGYFADKYSPKRVIIFSTIFGSIFFYIFLITTTMPVWGVLTILFLTGALLGVINPVAVALGNQILPTRPGLVSAFLMGLVWSVSEGIGPGGAGLLTKLFEIEAPAKALAVLGVLFFFGLAITLRLPYHEIEEFDIDKDHD